MRGPVRRTRLLPDDNLSLGHFVLRRTVLTFYRQFLRAGKVLTHIPALLLCCLSQCVFLLKQYHRSRVCVCVCSLPVHGARGKA